MLSLPPIRLLRVGRSAIFCENFMNFRDLGHFFTRFKEENEAEVVDKLRETFQRTKINKERVQISVNLTNCPLTAKPLNCASKAQVNPRKLAKNERMTLRLRSESPHVLIRTAKQISASNQKLKCA